LTANYHESGFDVLKVDVVGPTAGKQLQTQAWLATAYSLLGMLVYLWFRFELIYGVAAVVAVFHDTLITVGAFSLANPEIEGLRAAIDIIIVSAGGKDPHRVQKVCEPWSGLFALSHLSEVSG
jgi:Protein export membrane protein